MKENLAPVKQLFDQLVSTCIQNYSISEFVTINEILDCSRGKLIFHAYIKTNQRAQSKNV